MDQMFRNVNVSKVLSSRRKYWNIFVMLAFPSRHMKPSIYIYIYIFKICIFSYIYSKNFYMEKYTIRRKSTLRKYCKYVIKTQKP